jgi:hypothetical protein
MMMSERHMMLLGTMKCNLHSEIVVLYVATIDKCHELNHVAIRIVILVLRKLDDVLVHCILSSVRQA